mmetsp:Transcript_2915/g.7573  ORF Transcript_2915/g.7573 Transcript_2915/m.7573 type:complete len:152 (-) Transcript_2915:1525-1980(-)
MLASPQLGLDPDILKGPLSAEQLQVKQLHTRSHAAMTHVYWAYACAKLSKPGSATISASVMTMEVQLGLKQRLSSPPTGHEGTIQSCTVSVVSTHEESPSQGHRPRKVGGRGLVGLSKGYPVRAQVLPLVHLLCAPPLTQVLAYFLLELSF